MKRFVLLYLIVLGGFFACDSPDCPYTDERLCDEAYRDSIEGIEGGGGDTLAGDTGIVTGSRVCYSPEVFETYQKSVLLEDFTGFRCTNCVDAAITADNLQDEWGARLVVVAYHVTTQFAAPIADPPDPFSTDFRTPEGESLIVEFQIPALPNGLVSRNDFGSGQIQAAGSWPESVNELMNEAPTGFVRFRDVEINGDSSQVSFKVASRIFGEVDRNYNLVVGVFENNIIEAQKDGEETLFPYNHNHVFRANYNGLYGQTVFSSGQEFDDNCADLFEFQGNIADEWKASDCYLFAYLTDAETLEVIQAVKLHLGS